MFSSIRLRDHWGPLVCAIVAAVTLLACLPFGEFSFNDDWSYSHIALNFFRLGHMSYDGWCTPTLLVQALWGSLLIHIFGFSFELLRFSTLLVAVGCAVLLQRLGRSAGFTPITATFASLAFVTSPLFIPLATSFMTDVWACFFMLLCFYFAVKAPTSMRPALWLAAALIAGFVGGLDRQTVYIAPGSVLLWALWHWRREPRKLAAVVFLLAALGVGALLALRWQANQPLAAGEVTAEILSWRKMAAAPAQMGLTLALLLLPVLVRFGNGLLRLPLRFYILSSALVAGCFFVYWRITHQVIFPWRGNILTQFGILFSGEELKGERPPILSHNVRLAITVLVLAVLVRTGAVVLNGFKKNFLWSSWSGSPAILQIFTIFITVYAAFLIVISRAIVFDRYLLPLLPIVLIAVLYVNQKRAGNTLAVANWVILAVFAMYGISATHDYYAELRARSELFGKIRAAGIPANQISGGFELDGWTQVEIANRVYEPPPMDPASKDAPAQQMDVFLRFLRNLDPRYYIAWSNEPGFRTAALPGASFSAWMPPFRRNLTVIEKQR